MSLTFGVEIEHIFAFNTEPGPGYEWMFGSENTDDQSENDNTSPPSWSADHDIPVFSAPVSPLITEGWHSEAPDWEEGDFPQPVAGCPDGPAWDPLPIGWDVESTKLIQLNILRRAGLSCTNGGYGSSSWSLTQVSTPYVTTPFFVQMANY